MSEFFPAVEMENFVPVNIHPSIIIRFRVPYGEMCGQHDFEFTRQDGAWVCNRNDFDPKELRLEQTHGLYYCNQKGTLFDKKKGIYTEAGASIVQALRTEVSLKKAKKIAKQIEKDNKKEEFERKLEENCTAIPAPELKEFATELVYLLQVGGLSKSKAVNAARAFAVGAASNGLYSVTTEKRTTKQLLPEHKSTSFYYLLDSEKIHPSVKVELENSSLDKPIVFQGKDGKWITKTKDADGVLDSHVEVLFHNGQLMMSSGYGMPGGALFIAGKGLKHPLPITRQVLEWVSRGETITKIAKLNNAYMEKLIAKQQQKN